MVQRSKKSQYDFPTERHGLPRSIGVTAMSVINTQIKPKLSLSVMPTKASVSAYLRMNAENTANDGTMSTIVLGWYNDVWSMFRREGATDFTAKEWVKRTFKAPAQALEDALKTVDPNFDQKIPHYKNTKSKIGKFAYAGLTLEKEDKDKDGKRTLRLKTITELEIELKANGTAKESFAEMILRACGVLVPVDRDGEVRYHTGDYTKAKDDIDDMQPVLRAVEALGLVIGFERMERIAAGFAESMLPPVPVQPELPDAAQAEADKKLQRTTVGQVDTE